MITGLVIMITGAAIVIGDSGVDHGFRS